MQKVKEDKFDKGNKNFQPSNLEFTSISVDNKALNVIPSRARAQFNIRYNNSHTSSSLKKKISFIVKKLVKKISVIIKLIIWQTEMLFNKTRKNSLYGKKIIKKITKINPKLSTTGGTSDADL